MDSRVSQSESIFMRLLDLPEELEVISVRVLAFKGEPDLESLAGCASEVKV